MKQLVFYLLLLAYTPSYAQPLADSNAQDAVLVDISQRQTNFSRMGMISLSGWAAGNMIVGGISMSGTTGQEHYFHQMNLFWNVVNLGIGIPGLIGTYKEKPTDFQSVINYQHRLEKVYLFNMGLDVGYVASGWALNNFGKTKTGELGERFKGYGNSLVLQGTYLFVHDIVMLLFYRSNQKAIGLSWKKMTIQPMGLGMVIQFN